jgi:hypothetical protein
MSSPRTSVAVGVGSQATRNGSSIGSAGVSGAVVTPIATSTLTRRGGTYADNHSERHRPRPAVFRRVPVIEALRSNVGVNVRALTIVRALAKD